MRKAIFLFCLCTFWAGIPKAMAQGVGGYRKAEIDLERFVEELFAVQDTDIDYEDLYESLFNLYLNPIDLNRANREDLQSTYVLTELQINNFLHYREETGKLLSIYELQAISEFDLTTIQRLLPFVTVSEAFLTSDNEALWRRILNEPNNYLVMRWERTLEERRGYTRPDTLASGALTSRYLGSPDKLFARYRISHPKDFSMGFTTEKDPGEQLIWDPETSRYGMDFWSAHFFVQNKGKLKSLAIGDYQLQLGQGMIFSAGFAPGKGAESITTTRRSNLGLRPYTSVLETQFFRGAAATYAVSKNIDVTALASRAPQDGSILIDSLADDDFREYFNSIRLTGFHRTPSEIAGKNQITESNLGGNVLYRSNNRRLQLGANALYTQFSLPIQRRPTLYNQFEFNGSSNLIGGIFYNYLFQNFNFFGEAAMSQSGGKGLISGMIGSLSSEVEIAMLFRHYDKDFHSFYGNSFGEGARPINETGMYWGLKYRPSRKLFMTAYYDKFYFPWLRFRANAPTEGYEYLSRITYLPSRKIALFVQFREEGKEINLPLEGRATQLVGMGVRRNGIVNIDYATDKSISFKSRVQFSTYTLEGNTSAGFAIMQDINVDFRRWRISNRIAAFEVDDFDNRQYVYERNVLYAFAIPAYFGAGVRNYSLIQYNASRRLTLWLRYARTRYTDRNVIGTGLETIDGNTRTDVVAQVRYKFG